MLHHLSKREKLIIMLAVMSGLFVAALDQTIVGTALPKILTEFNALKELSWVVTAYLLTQTIAVPVAGKLSDIYGRRKLLMTGLVLFVAASMLCGISQNIWQLVGFRALQGIGGGILFSCAFTVIGDLFTPRERGKWQGIFGAVFGLASVVGPLLGGFLTDNVSWRWTFYINVPVGAVAFFLIAKYLPTITFKVKETIDYIGTALLSVGLAALILACSLGGTQDWAWDSMRIIGLFALSAVSLMAFIFAEHRAKNPILPLTLFKNATFNLTSVVIFLFGIAFFGTIIYIPLFAQDVLKFSATNAGVITLPMVIGLTIASVISGRIVAKTGKYKFLYVLGLIIATVGVYLLSLLGTHSTYFDLAWRMFLAGLGIGMSLPLFTLAVQNSFDQKLLGVATSSTQLFRSIGGTVGTAVLGSVLNNVLISKLGDIQKHPFVQMAKASGRGDGFAKLDINSVQFILSKQGQATILSSLAHVPAQIRDMAIASFNSFSETLRTALSDSITRIFVVSTGLMVLAVLISLFLREAPLRHSNPEDIAPPSEG
jgi:EmrB/QacA subfamily drug resistance transporter